MLVENQFVKVKWIFKNREHYENKGYVFTKWYEEFEINADDLSEGANVELMFLCDNPCCNEIFPRKYCNYVKANRVSFCSKKCAQNPEKRIIYTKESLIEDFWRYYLEFKKYPLTDDFKFNKNYPELNVVRRRFASWDNYLKEVGVVHKDTQDGWYLNDEALLRRYYPNNEMDEIISKLMIKRTVPTIRMKANSLGLKIIKEIKYPLKYKNDETRKRLINEAIDFYNNLKRSPYLFELESVDNPKNAVSQNWNSYNEFLEECNLPIFRRTINLKTKEDGIIFLNNLKELLARNPFITELDSYGVGKSWFTRIFGSYKDALFESGLIGIEDLDDQIKLDNSINGFKKLYNEIERVPSFKEYKNFASANNLFSPNTFIEKLEGVTAYTELCRVLVGKANWLEYNESELIDNLITLYDKLGRPPMGKELVEHGYPSICVYKTFFNKRYFNDIIRDLGWEPTGQDSQYKSDEELLDDYSNLYNKLGRIPLRDDIDESDKMCHSATYLTRFGGIANVCDLLDLNYNELIADSSMGSGTSCFDKNREICRSIPEMKISNILIDYGIKFIKEYPYNKITNKNDKRRFDWYLPDHDIYMEYFGLFDENRTDDDSWNGVYARKTIQKIEDCKKLNKKLIDIYPKDYKNNFTGLVIELSNIKRMVI